MTQRTARRSSDLQAGDVSVQVRGPVNSQQSVLLPQGHRHQWCQEGTHGDLDVHHAVVKLPPTRFRLKTITILVAVVGMQLGLARVMIQMVGPDDGVRGPLYIFALLFTPGIVRGLTHDGK